MRGWFAGLALALGIAGGAAAGAPAYKAPRTPLGQPDLQGVWNTAGTLPIESTPFTPNLVVPEAEAREIVKKLADQGRSAAVFKLDPEVADRLDSAEKQGLARVRGERRTRQVIEPADGKIPWTPGMARQVRFIEGQLQNNPDPPLPTDNPEQRPSGERCLAQFGQAPVFNFVDINPREIVQTRDQVVLHMEYGNELRVVPYATAHRPGTETSTFGDAIARWDGDTLVIETVRMPQRDVLRLFPVMLVSSDATVIEKYRRIGPDELLYQYTVIDPKIYARPWLAEYALGRAKAPIYEFACHEGNYSLPSILRAARAAEAERAKR
jgi:hypothetical protein